jgi:hypothetical protein
MLLFAHPTGSAATLAIAVTHDVVRAAQIIANARANRRHLIEIFERSRPRDLPGLSL